MAKRRKGLSLDDKRTAILGIYHEKREPLNLKEIESFGAKAGVVQQTIKDINQSLVDDSLVCAEKIGAANFYWSFPSKSYHDQLYQKETLMEDLHNLESSVNALKSQLNAMDRTRCNPTRRNDLKRYLDALEVEKELDGQLELFKFNDPQEINLMENRTMGNQDAANRWTDNIWTLKTFLIRKKGMNSKEVDKILKTEGDFDYPSAQ